jgi:Flp pilus assembly protein TadG
MSRVSIRPHWSDLGPADGGMSTIEFALVSSLLASLAVGVLDFGTGLLEQMEVGNAARAGADYAQVNAYNSSNITSAVQNATRLSVEVPTGTPLQFYGCPDVSSGISSVSVGTTCPSTSATAGRYVTVSAQTSYSTIFTYPGIPNPLTLTASATVRTQ